jgi:hypothetical protein
MNQMSGTDHLDVEPEAELISLRNGPTVTVDALLLVLRLEAVGVLLFIDARDRLIARPRELVSSEDAALIHQYLDDVKRIVRYVPPEL